MAKRENSSSFLRRFAKIFKIDVESIEKNTKNALRARIKELEASNATQAEKNVELSKENETLKDRLEHGIAIYTASNTPDVKSTVDVKSTLFYNLTVNKILSYFASSNMTIEEYKNWVNSYVDKAIDSAVEELEVNDANVQKDVDAKNQELEERINNIILKLEENGDSIEEYQVAIDMIKNRSEKEIKAILDNGKKANAKINNTISEFEDIKNITMEQFKEVLELYGVKSITGQFVKVYNNLKNKLKQDAYTSDFTRYSFGKEKIEDEEIKAFINGSITGDVVTYTNSPKFQKLYNKKLAGYMADFEIAKKCKYIAKLTGDQKLIEAANESYVYFYNMTQVTENEVKENLIIKTLLKVLKKSYKEAKEVKKQAADQLKEQGGISKFVAKISGRTITKKEGNPEDMVIKLIEGETL